MKTYNGRYYTEATDEQPVATNLTDYERLEGSSTKENENSESEESQTDDSEGSTEEKPAEDDSGNPSEATPKKPKSHKAKAKSFWSSKKY